MTGKFPYRNNPANAVRVDTFLLVVSAPFIFRIEVMYRVKSIKKKDDPEQ